MMWVLIVLLVLMEVMEVTCNTLSKAAMAKGMNNFIFTTYTHAIAFFFLIPFAFFYHRKTPAPPISLPIIVRLCLLGSICCGCSIFIFMGIQYSSPTLASAMNNISPAFTFIIAIISRMEILNLRAQSSLLKLIGTLVSITGAFVVTFYQGVSIITFPESPTKASLTLHLLLETIKSNWVWGSFFCATSSIFLSFSYVIKTWIARDYPSEVLIAVIFVFFETIMAAMITLVAEWDNPSVWFPSGSIALIAIMFGALDVAIVNVLNTWACRKKGPLFVAMFKPLEMIIAAVMGVSFLHDDLHLGSVIGGTIIAGGFYTVMMGKAEEETCKYGIEENGLICSSDKDFDHKVPLLKDKRLDL